MNPLEPAGWVDPNQYPALEALQTHFELIRSELEGVLAAGIPWFRFGIDHSVYGVRGKKPEEIRQIMATHQVQVGSDTSHKIFGLVLARSIIEELARFCPETCRLVAEIPEVLNAGFACLEPGHQILPHRGGDPRINKCHFGLIVPDGDCKIRVEGEVRKWRTGEALVFDDSSLHEVWNNTTEPRFVLLTDLLKPGLP